MPRPRGFPEAAAVDDQDLLLEQQIPCEFLVRIRDVEPRESVESTPRLDQAQAWSGIRPCHSQVAAAAQFGGGFRQVPMRPLQRRAHSVLFRTIRAQARAQQLVDALEVRLHVGRFPAHDTPADAPAGSEVGFRKPAEGHHRQIGCERRDGSVRPAVEDQLVVNLVGENHQVVLARKLHDCFERLPGMDGARWIVRVDDHHPARPRKNVAGELLEVRLPARAFVELVAIR